MTAAQLTPETMEQHVRDLGKAFKVRVLIKAISPDRMVAQHLVGTAKKRIIVPPIDSEEVYAGALHELGHCIDPMGMMWHQMSKFAQMMGSPSTRADFAIQLECERAAWKWAEHYALVWTDRMANVRRMTFATYKRNARRLGIV